VEFVFELVALAGVLLCGFACYRFMKLRYSSRHVHNVRLSDLHGSGRCFEILLGQFPPLHGLCLAWFAGQLIAGLPYVLADEPGQGSSVADLAAFKLNEFQEPLVLL
jgi:hypothetical protein